MISILLIQNTNKSQFVDPLHRTHRGQTHSTSLHLLSTLVAELVVVAGSEVAILLVGFALLAGARLTDARDRSSVLGVL